MDSTSINVATIASSESPCNTWIQKETFNRYEQEKMQEKRENKDTAQFHVPHPLVQRGKSQSRFCPAIPDQQVASGTWVTNEQRTCGTRGTCQRGVQEHSVSVSRTFEKLILGLGCLFAAHLPSENAKKSPKLKYVVQANLHQFLLLEAQLFRT